jgi:LysR family transcriptional repressor of citA
MDLKLLRTFQVAARHMNFHETAETLYLSQPTVSKHIRQLEDELGCDLFQRWGRSLSLTPAGERFLICVNHILAETDAMMQEFTAWQAGYSSRLTVAASPMVARTVLPWVLQAFHERMPKVEVVITVVMSEEIPEAIIDGKAEVGLSRIEPHDPRLTGELLYQDPVVFVVGGPQATSRVPVPNSSDSWQNVVENFQLITHNHPGYWEDILIAVRQHVPRFRTLVVTQVDITKRLIEEGLGVSFLPLSAVNTEIQAGTLNTLEVPDVDMPVANSWLVLRKDKPLSSGARSFASLARECTKRVTTFTL